MNRSLAVVAWLISLMAIALTGGASVSAEERNELSQYGITWHFNAPARIGRT